MGAHIGHGVGLLVVIADIVGFVERSIGFVETGGVGYIAEIHRCPGVTGVVGVVSVVARVGVMPAVEVHIVVVGAHVMMMVVWTHVGVIRRYCPYKSGYRSVAAETQICRCAVHVAGMFVEEPHAV